MDNKLDNSSLSKVELEKAYAYIKGHKEIWEVILTGGDPLILKPQKIAEILNQLSQIEHVGVIRIHTRVPVVDSARITDEMIAALKVQKAVYMILHTNHANELTEYALSTCKKIIDAGIPMLSQSVLLKGINDNPEVLTQLFKTLVSNWIKPYYLHHGDLAKGTSHFRTSIESGQFLMKELRGSISGLCQPTYVLDIPGGHGKVPIGPNYVSTHVCCTPKSQVNNINDMKNKQKKYVIEDPAGNFHDYASIDMWN